MTQPITAAVTPSNKNISPYEKPSIAHCLIEEKLNSFETLKSSIKGRKEIKVVLQTNLKSIN